MKVSSQWKWQSGWLVPCRLPRQHASPRCSFATSLSVHPSSYLDIRYTCRDLSRFWVLYDDMNISRMV